ncbi:MAG: zinc-dependent metalloprotease [Saprospiraceae bacterium]|nr:zinc-dependent metalloprotease [Saprospiraceae bacterium]
MKNHLIFPSIIFFLISQVTAQDEVNLVDMDKSPGFFDFYWDGDNGKIYLEIDKFDTEFLYSTALSAGIGSNDIGLDRGQLGGEFVVVFSKIGKKILLKAKNLGFRANSQNDLEQKAVSEAFAESVLWGFVIKQETDNGYLVDATSFIVRDAHGVSDRLANSDQGSYRLEDTRSAIYLPRTKNFPKNTELEATLTFIGDAKGSLIRSVTPDPKAVTVRQHHSLIELPNRGYQPRVFDPRCGYFPMTYLDYASQIDQPIAKRYIRRHFLQKKDPSAQISEPLEPIIYYMDAGAPEPVKSALMEGASWWNQAFSAAGYKNAFEVRVMPADADPMDVRYNLIQWVHRSTRGWSYGASIIDPRTGEILKGHVSLGSLRVRQDYLIAQGLDASFKEGKSNEPLVELALARLRQLAAHEVGHTLGLAHNFAASTNDRASVMDYPHPYVKIDDNGTIDFSDAYDVNIGEWDKRAILYGYQDFAPGQNEEEELRAILNGNDQMGLDYISDQDARPAYGAHLSGHLWDGGSSVVEELDRMIDVRQKALAKFGRDNIPEGAPMADLELILVPLYLSHRYQAEAVSKIIAGIDYRYSVKGDLSNEKTKMVESAQQEAAIRVLLKTLSPEYLTLPESIISLIPPVPIGYSRGREHFKTRTGLSFDPITAAEVSAGTTLGFMLNPQRMSRLFEQHTRNASRLSVADFLDGVANELSKNVRNSSNMQKAVAEAVEAQFIFQLISLAADQSGHHQVSGLARQKLLEYQSGIPGASRGHSLAILSKISEFLADPAKYQKPDVLPMPDGSPIGCSSEF